MLRTIFLVTALTGFSALAAIDLAEGNHRVGIAAGLLVVVNWLLLA